MNPSKTTARVPRRAFNRVLSAVLLAAALPAAQAAWPDKPLKLIVPAPPGGTLDIVGRVLAEQMAADLGQPVVVENKPGAAGGIGAGALKAAPADGYTMLVVTSGLLTENPHVIKMPFDPLKDLMPLAAFTRAGMVLVGPASLPAHDLKSLIAYVKANPGKLSITSYSPGTIGHYASVLLNQRAGLDLTFVPFAGSAPALQQVMGGQIALMFDGWATSKPMLDGGRLKAFGVPGTARSPQLPNVPSFGEQGYADLVPAFANWQGVVVQAGTPADVAAKLRAAVLQATAKPAVRERLVGAGLEVIADPGMEELKRSVAADYERNAGIVKKFEISLNK